MGNQQSAYCSVLTSSIFHLCIYQTSICSLFNKIESHIKSGKHTQGIWKKLRKSIPNISFQLPVCHSVSSINTLYQDIKHQSPLKVLTACRIVRGKPSRMKPDLPLAALAWRWLDNKLMTISSETNFPLLTTSASYKRTMRKTSISKFGYIYIYIYIYI